MALSAGTRLGPYAILAPLGAGGMGEVYRALDARLEREVAIKVLPAELASDTERLKRFEKEARSASSLNHPNIVTIHDIGSDRGVSYIAMERVEGSTLRELMAGGPLSLKRLLAISTQITEGLARAHEAGIVHRDLKPENVMVTKEGLVKILDFGLAKLESKTSGSGEGSQLPTMTGTSPGVVVGTVGYMSPEQASAAPLDFHSDQFALGSILYEMASGKRAFQKKTAVETLTAILNEEPEPLEQAAPQVPAPLRWIVERCHSKQPEDRYVSTRDLARELAMVRDHASEITSRGTLQAASARKPGRRLLVFAAAAALAGAGLAAGWYSRGRSPHLVAELRQVTFRRGFTGHGRFAPDGQTIVYAANWDGPPSQVYTTRVDNPESRSLGLPPADVLSVSSSGELAIALERESGDVLATVPLTGGAPAGDSRGSDRGGLAAGRNGSRRHSARRGQGPDRIPDRKDARREHQRSPQPPFLSEGGPSGLRGIGPAPGNGIGLRRRSERHTPRAGIGSEAGRPRLVSRWKRSLGHVANDSGGGHRASVVVGCRVGAGRSTVSPTTCASTIPPPPENCWWSASGSGAKSMVIRRAVLRRSRSRGSTGPNRSVFRRTAG